MSIYDELRDRVNEGRLFRHMPRMPGARASRTLFASASVNQLILGPWTDIEWEMRCGFLSADFDKYMEGRLLVVASRPYGARTAFLAKLDADEVWELRSRDPKPSIRVLGRFAATDIFVALNWWNRADLYGKKSREWRDAIEDCKTQWRNLFPTYKPHNGIQVHAYISANVVVI